MMLRSLAFALVALCASRADALAPGRPLGVYVLPGGTVLQLKRDAFRLFYPPHRGGDPKGSVRYGERFIDLVGRKYVGSASCSYAVVDGHLWLGVLVPAGGDAWEARACSFALGQPNREVGTPVRVRWNRRTGAWTYASGGHSATWAGVVVRDEERPERFLVSFSSAQRSPPAKRNAVWKALGGFAYGPWGRCPRPYFPREADAEHVRALASDPARRRAALDEERRDPCPRWFVERGDVILPPWAVDLGPAGLVPVAGVDPAGTWRSESDPARELRVVSPAEVHGGAGAHDVRFGQGPDLADCARWRGRHVWNPDGEGVSTNELSWNCGMGHMDASNTALFIPTSDARAAAFFVVTRGIHGGCGPPTDRPGPEVYQRKEEPRR